MRSYSFLFWAFATAIAAHAFFIQLATALPATDIDVPAVNTTSTPFTCWAQFCVRILCTELHTARCVLPTYVSDAFCAAKAHR